MPTSSTSSTTSFPPLSTQAEHSYKLNPKLLAQLQHCEEYQIPYAVILGDGELSRGVVKLREIATRKEEEVALDTFIEELRRRLLSAA